MSSKNLLILVVVLALLGGAAYFTRDRGAPSAGPDAPGIGDAIVPGLDVNQVQAITITGPDGTNRLARVEGTWVVASLHNYPANFARIREQLTGLKDLKIGQVMRADAATRTETGLGDTTTLVTLLGASDQELAIIRLGSPRTMGNSPGGFGGYPDGQYIGVGDEHIAVVSRSMSGLGSTSPSEWIERQLLQVDANEIASIAVDTGEEAYVIQNDTNQVMTLDGLGDDETFESTSAGQVKRALAYLSCQDVADPTLTDEAMGLDQPATYTVTLRDGKVYTAFIGSSTNNNRYARFAVVGDEERAYLKDWTYLIPTYAADSMTTARDTLVKAVEKEDPEPEAEADTELGPRLNAAPPAAPAVPEVPEVPEAEPESDSDV